MATGCGGGAATGGHGGDAVAGTGGTGTGGTGGGASAGTGGTGGGASAGTTGGGASAGTGGGAVAGTGGGGGGASADTGGTSGGGGSGPVTCGAQGYAAVKSIAAGFHHACVLTTTGGVRCWGQNEAGQLGDGTTENRNMPTADVLIGVEAIAVGWSFTCAWLAGGEVRCWGRTFLDAPADHTIPQKIDALAGARMIDGGITHACAVTATGGLRCWGSNDNGELGNGTQGGQANTSAVPSTDVLTGVARVGVGMVHTCAVMATGGVRCWGGNASGQLGDGTTMNRATVPTADLLTGVRALANGNLFTCALMTAGGQRCWGTLPAAKIVLPPSTDDMTGVAQIDATADQSCSLMAATGGVRCWGVNITGQVGNGTQNTLVPLPPPATDVLTGVQQVASGATFTCALLNTGRVRCWGGNVSGELGDGSPPTTIATARTSPPTTDVPICL